MGSDQSPLPPPLPETPDPPLESKAEETAPPSATSHFSLSSLNPHQVEAVSAGTGVALVYAGPGSGKTKVICHRVAYLVEKMNVKPSEIILVTFTNKAANEMKERVEGLIGAEKAKLILMGTFHATCMFFLKKHHAEINLPRNFLIADSADSKQIVRKSIEAHEFTLNVDQVISVISKAKNNGLDQSNFFRAGSNYDDETLKIKKVYEDYERQLRSDGLLDFDDLLVFANRLFERAPHILSRFEHILVDEFQDTNMLQYSITKKLAHRENLFVVGDPDQSIYTWRNANVDYITTKVKEEYKNKFAVHYLRVNYRSTGNILKTSQMMINQEKNREKRDFRTNNIRGPPVTLRVVKDARDETRFIASEISRLVSTLKPLLDYSDFSILMRTNAMTHNIEEALILDKIPYRVIGDIKFFDRLEVKDLVAYLRLAENPRDRISFERALNTPPREIGKVGLAAIVTAADKAGLSCLELARKLVKGDHVAGCDKKVSIPGLTSFVKVVDNLIKAKRSLTVSVLLKKLLEEIKYTEHLQKKFPKEWESRMENVQELVNYASRFDFDESQSQTSQSLSQKTPPNQISQISQTSQLSPPNSGTSDAGMDLLNDGAGSLSKFLEVAVLSSSSDDPNIKCVSVSTVHSAKGLEWPCVFIMGIEEGSIPHSRSIQNEEAVREERRLLYVGMTRAQCFLYLTASNTRWVGGASEVRAISRFLQVFNYDDVSQLNEELWSSSPPKLSGRVALALEQMLGRTRLLEKGITANEEELQPSPQYLKKKGLLNRSASMQSSRSQFTTEEDKEKEREKEKEKPKRIDPATQQFSSFVSATSVFKTRPPPLPATQQTQQPQKEQQRQQEKEMFQQFGFQKASALKKAASVPGPSSSSSSLAESNPARKINRSLFHVQDLFSIVAPPTQPDPDGEGDSSKECGEKRPPPSNLPGPKLKRPSPPRNLSEDSDDDYFTPSSPTSSPPSSPLSILLEEMAPRRRGGGKGKKAANSQSSGSSQGAKAKPARGKGKKAAPLDLSSQQNQKMMMNDFFRGGLKSTPTSTQEKTTKTAAADDPAPQSPDLLISQEVQGQEVIENIPPGTGIQQAPSSPPLGPQVDSNSTNLQVGIFTPELISQEPVLSVPPSQKPVLAQADLPPPEAQGITLPSSTSILTPVNGILGASLFSGKQGLSLKRTVKPPTPANETPMPEDPAELKPVERAEMVVVVEEGQRDEGKREDGEEQPANANVEMEDAEQEVEMTEEEAGDKDPRVDSGKTTARGGKAKTRGRGRGKGISVSRSSSKGKEKENVVVEGGLRQGKLVWKQK